MAIIRNILEILSSGVKSFAPSQEYQITTSNLSGSLNLDNDSNYYQYLNPNGLNRIINLPTTVDIGKRFYVKNTASYSVQEYLLINVSSSQIESISPQSSRKFIWTGSVWQSVNEGGGHQSAVKKNISIGIDSSNYNESIGIGHDQILTNAIAVGNVTTLTTNSNAISHQADDQGYQETTHLKFASQADRRTETILNNDLDRRKLKCGIANWYGDTIDNVLQEIYLGGNIGSRFNIVDNSTVGFKITTIIQEGQYKAAKHITDVGTIQRVGGTTGFITPPIGTTQTLIRETGIYTAGDTNSWVVQVTADNINNALIVSVQGESGTDIRWHSCIQYFEVRYDTA